MEKLGPDYTQILEIIGTDKFEEFVKALEKEGVGIGVTRKIPSLGRYIYPMKTREKFNFEIPVLSASFTRRMEGIATFDPIKLPAIGELDEKGNFKEINVTLITALESTEFSVILAACCWQAPLLVLNVQSPDLTIFL